MTVEIKENTYCVGLWMLVSEADHPKEILEVCEHLGLDPNEMPKTPLEHLCSLYRHGDELWNFDIRQRVILDDKTGADSIDAKKFYRVTFDQQMDEAEARAHAERFINKFSEEFHCEVDFQPVYENFGEWLTRRRKQGTLPKWMHVSEEKIDD